MKLILTGSVESINTRQDNTVKFVLGTQELGSEQAAKLFEFRGKFIKILLTDANIQPLEERMIEETKIVDGKRVKTKSQRLRSVLYVAWEQSGLQIEFDDYYNKKMEQYIEVIKSQLE